MMSKHSKIGWSASLATAFALAPNAAFALQPLEDFTRSARASNFDEREAGLVAEQRKHEAGTALGRLLPTVSATGSYTHNQYEVNVSRPDGAGHTVTAIITPLNQLDATFSLRVPVIDVGGWMRLAAARRTEESAGLRFEASQNDADAEVARNYFGLVGATWLRDAAEKTLAAAERNLDVLIKRREAERALETDVLRARAEVERAKKAIAEADNQVRSAARSLHTLTGLEPTPGVPTLEPPRDAELPRPELARLAANAPAVRAAAADVRAAEKARDAAWAAFAPTVSAAVNERVTNATGFAGKNGLLNLQVTATWALDYTTLTQARASEAAAGAAKVRAERAQQAQLDVVADAADRVEVQAVRARAATAEEDAATHLVAHWRERLATGNATLLEVVQAERDAFAATASRIQAEADLAYARQLLRAKTKGSVR